MTVGWVSSCASELRLKHSHTQSHYTSPPHRPLNPDHSLQRCPRAGDRVAAEPEHQSSQANAKKKRRRKAEEFAVVSQFVSTKTIPQSVWTKPDPHKHSSLQIPGKQVWLDLLDKVVSVWCPAVGLILLCCCFLGFFPLCITVWEKWGGCFLSECVFSVSCFVLFWM